MSGVANARQTAAARSARDEASGKYRRLAASRIAMPTQTAPVQNSATAKGCDTYQPVTAAIGQKRISTGVTP
jgi:hypothetical protein